MRLFLVAPMLAVPTGPFDDPAYLFEIKWDGIRALAAVESSGWRLWGRGLADYTARYPELAVLRRLPAGTMLDGEVVVIRQGVPNLSALLRRHALASSFEIRQAWRWCPVRYMVFDVLYHGGQCLMQEPLQRRRELLEEVRLQVADPLVLSSAGVIGQGRQWYEAAVALGHEGVMAKALTSVYRPGRRSATWRKIKPKRPQGRRGGWFPPPEDGSQSIALTPEGERR